MDDRVRQFVTWEATFQSQPCSYSNPEFYLKAGIPLPFEEHPSDLLVFCFDMF